MSDPIIPNLIQSILVWDQNQFLSIWQNELLALLDYFHRCNEKHLKCLKQLGAFDQNINNVTYRAILCTGWPKQNETNE